MQTLLGKHWHHLPSGEVVQLLETDTGKGLDVFEVKHRQERLGANRLSPRKGKSNLVRFLLQFRSPLIYILVLAGVITAIIKDPVDSIIIFAVVLVNAVIGYMQESKAEKAMEALARAMTTEASVTRSGHQQSVSATELVPGDIILLRAGNKVPADVRLLSARDLQIAEASLTGESVPVQKDAAVSLPPETVLAERSNMAYASTLVVSGQGTGVVTAIGDSTEVGRIAQLIAEADEIATPLTRKIARFSNLVLYAILGLAAVTFVIGLLRGQPVVDTFTAAVALAVAMIPEGLPAAVTITLAAAVSRMARQRAIVRRLPAVETLGSVTVICTDKTGTLTQNQMTVRKIAAGGAYYDVTGTGYNPSGQITLDGQVIDAQQSPVALSETLAAGALCNDSTLAEQDGAWQAQGDPTEVALVVAAHKGGQLQADLRQGMPRLDVVPFDSRHQYMATLHSSPESGRSTIYLKGAVEVIAPRCTDALDSSGRAVSFAPDRIHAEVDAMASLGLRVLAFARRDMPGDTRSLQGADVAAGLTFIGLQGMIDPPRPEAKGAVQACREAGVGVKMITGDHALTALAIAVQIGLAEPCPDSSPRQDCVMTGQELAAMSDDELIAAVDRVSVLARVSPEQKLRLVDALQARGEVVAMTGDGVNDGPALKQADIGVAMGITGTDVAKEAADIILTDDNFSTIETAIEEGRAVYDNLTKIIAWTLPTNVGEGMILVLAILLGITLPLLPIHILWINTVAAAILGLTLAVEVKEPHIMRRTPRPPNAPILTRDLLWRLLLVAGMIVIGAFGLYEMELTRGGSVTQARTVAVNVVVVIGIFLLFNTRSLTYSMFQIGVFSNRMVIAGALGMILVQVLFTYVPLMNALLASAPIDLFDWAAIVAVGMISYLVIECEKWLRRRMSRANVS